jgi:hypothetical protein
MTAKELIVKELDEIKQRTGKINWWDVLDVVEGYEEHLCEEGRSPLDMAEEMMREYVDPERGYIF